MGRYAFFNTGFEYKFWFTIQDSNDITRFGGLGGMNDKGRPFYSWIDEDKSYILRVLHHFEKQNHIPELKPELYEKNLEGTQKMYSLLHSPMFHGYLTEEEQAFYCLGWVIYHQLSYQPALSCTYEP